MDIRTVSGTSISDALEEARSLWGDSVVMLQAQPPPAGGRARISVGVPVSSGAAARTGASRNPALDLLVSEESNHMSAPSSPLPGSLRRTQEARPPILADRIRPATEVMAHVSRDGKEIRPKTPFSDAPTETRREPIASDPLFMHLVRQGLRPARSRRLAERSRDAGPKAARAALAVELPEPVSGTPPSRVAFTGPAGSGKTSLVLRAALSRVRAGRTAPHIVVVAPRAMTGWQDPTPMLETAGLSVVRCGMNALESALSALDGDVLVDVPAGAHLPADLSVHRRLVVDARSAVPPTAREGQSSHSVVVTHLDQAPALGYVTERLIAMQLPVAALIRSAHPRQGAQAYTPTHLADLVCHA